ncbi:MAG: type VII secretion protein EssC, partial [Bacillota bacterium]
GKLETNDIIISSSLISEEHAKIYLDDAGEYHITDLNTTNGIFINGRRVYEAMLTPGDIIHISGYKIMYDRNILSISSDEDIRVKNLKPARGRFSKKKFEFPLFQRSPRLLPQMPKGEIEILNPPTAQTRPSISWITILLPPFMMAVVSVIMATFTKSIYMYFSLIMLGGTTMVSIFNYTSQLKKFKKLEEARKEKYLDYIHKRRMELNYAREQQKNSLLSIHPPLEECIERVNNKDRRLWEKTLYHSDFLSLRIGTGIAPLNISIKIPRQELSMENDILKEEPLKLLNEFSKINNVPVCLPLLEAGTAGLIGPREEVLNFTRSLIIQLASLHSYEDVKIVAVYSEKESNEWEWIRWLPHCWDDSRQQRFIADEKESAHRLFSNLYDFIKSRDLQLSSNDSYSSSAQIPHFVFFIADANITENEQIMSYLANSNKALGISTIFLFDRIEFLPRESKIIIEIDSKTGQFVRRDEEATGFQFSPDKLSCEAAEYFSRRMSSIRLKQTIPSANLPNSLPLLCLFDVGKVEDLNVTVRWQNSESFSSMAAPLGVKAGNEKLLLDIHERSHGPHGLVAGTTGSGKSELLQTYIISLAINYHPHYVSFVLIDYKGGGMAGAFKDLPHLVGTITNLGGNQTTRALVAIKSELKKRQTIFAQYNVNHIDSYQRLFKKGVAQEPLPHLIIIADEFAELKTDQPEFMVELVSAARVGRSLGVHLILATQKPAGVVNDQIWSNTRFRICLKVQGPEDSQEVIKRRDAANIKQPGRAYIQVGNNEIFELFQSAWSGAGYIPGAEQESTDDLNIYEVELDGTRRQLYTASQKKAARAEMTQLQAVVAHISETAEKCGIKRLDGPWFPPLPDKIVLNDLIAGVSLNSVDYNSRPDLPWMCPVIGILDNPAGQSQPPFSVDLGKEGHLAVYGGPGSGKTTFLQTLATSLVLSYSPFDVNIYILDLGGRTLNIFSVLPHVGGVVMIDESEKLRKLVKYLLKELDNRKKSFSSVGVSSLPAYRTATVNRLPALVIIVDNFSALAELYPETDDLFVQLSREGGNYGIHIVLTANNLSSIRYRVSANIKLAVALQMSDKGDYTSIVGRTNGLLPSPVNGRGLVKNNPPLEFQTALAIGGETEAERTEKLKKLFDTIKRSWQGPKAKPIPIMPSEVTLDKLYKSTDVMEYLKDKTMTIPIGLTDEDIEPMYLNLYDTPNLIVTGQFQSGKTCFLKTLTAALTKYNTPDSLNIYIVDSSSMGLYTFKQLPHVKAYITESLQLSDIVNELKNILEQRKIETNKARVASNGLFDEKTHLARYSSHVMIIDDYSEFLQTANLETKDNLEQILKRYRKLGFYLILTGISSDISSSYEGFIKALKELQTGIVFGNASDQQIFSRPPLGDSSRSMQPGEGYFVSRGRYLKMKSAFIDDSYILNWLKNGTD